MTQTTTADTSTAFELGLEQLPAPRPETGVDALPPERESEIVARIGEIDLDNTQSIIKFGAAAQEQLTVLSNEMLDGVRNKDLGPAGDSLRSMVNSIRGFDVSELEPSAPSSWWQRIFRKVTPLADVLSRYSQVRDQIDLITDRLNEHEGILLKDIKFLDKLYARSLDFYDELALYIEAGDRALTQIDEQQLPALAAAVESAAEDDGVLRAQELRDKRAARDDLERRIHDLRLTRQVTLQSLPSIRLVQENDKSLVNKIHSTLVNTVPLWQTQLAQAVTIFRSRDAAKTVREATDLTNELLTRNAENLQSANREIRTEMERGVFDINSIRQANQSLIATIEESLSIADEGKRKRAEAETELAKMEQELKTTLASARASKPQSKEAASAPAEPVA